MRLDDRMIAFALHFAGSSPSKVACACLDTLGNARFLSGLHASAKRLLTLLPCSRLASLALFRAAIFLFALCAALCSALFILAFLYF
jgi:hypothetical protein